MKKIALISLGCAKNTVDSEAILALFKEPYFKIVTDLNESDAIIINTCGFILSAKEEGINVILEATKYHKKLIVVGCLVQRYLEELKEEIPEVDLWVKFKDEYQHLPQMVQKLFKDEVVMDEFDIFTRVREQNEASTYVKISEGCDNFCAFCAIPLIRGRFVSYNEDDIVNYCEKISHEGTKEVVLIGQDPTSYGIDFKDKNINLVHLLKRIEAIPGIEFIRTLYLYPFGVTDELIDFIKHSKKMSHYFDIPVQHISNKILKLMNRKDSKEDTYNVLNKIKKEIPDVIIRTTLIVGFPGETQEDFNELKEFIKEFKFNHLGVFTYSEEEGTKASLLKDKVPQSVMDERKDEIMKLQAKISYQLNKELVGKRYRALITGVKNNGYEISCDYNAPDDIDGGITLNTNKKHEVGDIVDVEITDAFVYDLIAKEI